MYVHASEAPRVLSEDSVVASHEVALELAGMCLCCDAVHGYLQVELRQHGISLMCMSVDACVYSLTCL